MLGRLVQLVQRRFVVGNYSTNETFLVTKQELHKLFAFLSIDSRTKGLFLTWFGYKIDISDRNFKEFKIMTIRQRMNETIEDLLK